MAIRKAISIGSSVAVTIPKRFLSVTGIRAGDDISVEERAGGIFVRPLQNEATRDEKVAALALDFVKRYRKDLEALADK